MGPSMKNSVEINLKIWNEEHAWRKDGDEWDGQASYCEKPYEEWKAALIDEFLMPNLASSSNAGRCPVVLEIAPGHGRWTQEIVERCKELYLVDLSTNCIEFCKERFSGYDHVRYFVNNGRSLDCIEDQNIDFVWSFDSFVHMDEETITSYLGEISRVLKTGGIAIIHHAGRRHRLLWLQFLGSMGELGERLYRHLSLKNANNGDGWRSNMSRQLFKRIANDAGLVATKQSQYWGRKNEFGVPRYGDYITTLRKL